MLLRRFQAYFRNVARNLRRTYLRPFVIVTANMSKAVSRRGGRGAARAEPRSVQGARPPSGRPWGQGSTALASVPLSVE